MTGDRNLIDISRSDDEHFTRLLVPLGGGQVNGVESFKVDFINAGSSSLPSLAGRTHTYSIFVMGKALSGWIASQRIFKAVSRSIKYWHLMSCVPDRVTLRNRQIESIRVYHPIKCDLGGKPCYLPRFRLLTTGDELDGGFCVFLFCPQRHLDLGQEIKLQNPTIKGWVVFHELRRNVRQQSHGVKLIPPQK
eukprot:m.379408 g.379408  ORF g.379408 m.379408 type:complete len:192 (-) comp16708_c5_seq76:1648-2223(-)